MLPIFTVEAQLHHSFVEHGLYRTGSRRVRKWWRRTSMFHGLPPKPPGMDAKAWAAILDGDG